MKNKYIKSVLFICVTLLFCACEQQQVDDIQLQLINGPSCCTSSSSVSWDGDMVTLFSPYSRFTIVSKVTGTLSFDCLCSDEYTHLYILKDGSTIFRKCCYPVRKKIVINNVQKGDKFEFTRYSAGSYDANVLVSNIIITAGDGNNSNNSDNPGFDF